MMKSSEGIEEFEGISAADSKQPEPPSIQRQRRLLNRWSIFLLLIVSAAATVLYVSNVVLVNRMLGDREIMHKQVDSLKAVNQSLLTEINKLESSERITRIAAERLGMTPPSRPPIIVKRKTR